MSNRLNALLWATGLTFGWLILLAALGGEVGIYVWWATLPLALIGFGVYLARDSRRARAARAVDERFGEITANWDD